jgi:ATP-binding cassette subfamily C (CFTR/MRP) protein 1
MHLKMNEKVLRANITFFDSNPIGRITTRFSKDLSTLDNVMPTIFVFCSALFMKTIVSVIAAVFVNPWLGIAFLIGLIAVVAITSFGSRSMIECQRVEQETYGPINSTLNLLITGIVTLRAYRKFDFF